MLCTLGRGPSQKNEKINTVVWFFPLVRSELGNLTGPNCPGHNLPRTDDDDHQASAVVYSLLTAAAPLFSCSRHKHHRYHKHCKWHKHHKHRNNCKLHGYSHHPSDNVFSPPGKSVIHFSNIWIRVQPHSKKTATNQKQADKMKLLEKMISRLRRPNLTHLLLWSWSTRRRRTQRMMPLRS